MRYVNGIKDTMNNLSPDSGASDEYCRGLIVGLVAGLMFTGYRFDTALRLIQEAYHPAFRPGMLPPSWNQERVD